MLLILQPLENIYGKNMGKERKERGRNKKGGETREGKERREKGMLDQTLFVTIL